MATTSTSFRFDATLPAAQRAAARHAARLVKGVSEETRRGIRAAIVRAIREGQPPFEAARAIQPMIGLNAQQVQAALNYRAELIDQGLTLQFVDRKVDRYVQKKLRERAKTIARTEVMNALNAGQEESWRQAQRAGLLPKGQKKVWIVTPDDRLCPICEPMRDAVAEVGKPFLIPGPPAHPRCRCAVGIATDGR